MDTVAYQAEESLRTRFRGSILLPFRRALRDYGLIAPGDRIAVCISGGKDSMLMAKLMQLEQRESEIPFELVYLIMDPGYNPENRAKVEANARLLEIPYTLFESDVFEIANSQEKNPCFLCARMRRGWLYAKARELGCNKIALGHHLNDVIETTVMAALYGAQLQAMPPILSATNFTGMRLIRPLYCVREEAIVAWKNANGLSFIQCACRFTEQCSTCGQGGGSKRQEVKLMLKRLRTTDPEIEERIFQALHHVQWETFPRAEAR